MTCWEGENRYLFIDIVRSGSGMKLFAHREKWRQSIDRVVSE